MLRYRWNIWRHPGSTRLYHIIYSPPRSASESWSNMEQAIRKGLCPNVTFLLDDFTQEELEVVSCLIAAVTLSYAQGRNRLFDPLHICFMCTDT
jgi:hypothetical protein